MPRFFCPSALQVGRLVTLPPAVARHAVGSLRLSDGAAVTLFNGDGHEYSGRLSSSSSSTASVMLLERLSPKRESLLRVTLAQGISSGDRMDTTVQKAVELGVGAIQPLMMRRTIVRLAGDRLEKRRAKWEAVGVAACEQCGRNVVVPVAPIQGFVPWSLAAMATSSSSASTTTTAPPALRLMLDPEAALTLAQLPHPPPQARPRPPSGGGDADGEGGSGGMAVLLLAGPEGGFDDAEREAAAKAGFVGVRLGPRVLRTETASLAALAAMQTMWGDFTV
jgi:16S rRNA (uracil1498-N3)-methyltransferase